MTCSRCFFVLAIVKTVMIVSIAVAANVEGHLFAAEPADVHKLMEGLASSNTPPVIPRVKHGLMQEPAFPGDFDHRRQKEICSELIYCLRAVRKWLQINRAPPMMTVTV